MNGKKRKNKTTSLIDVMIRHADIEKQKAIEKQKQEQKKERENKTKKASALLQKYQANEEIRSLLADHYGDNTIVLSSFGNIDFSSEGKEDIVGGENLTYDDYIDIQIRSAGKQRSWFQMCYYNMLSSFMGCIGKKKGKNICFQKIHVSGMFHDGDGFIGKEDHVWMDIGGFENFKAGDCVSFSSEVYRYVKTSNGKLLDYGLRKPEYIKKISSYRLPSDEDLIRQGIDQIICETCFLYEHCNKLYCLRNEEEIRRLKKQMFDLYQMDRNAGANG